VFLVLIPDQATKRKEHEPRVVTSECAMPGPEADWPGAAMPANGFARFSRLLRFAGYAGLLAILVLSLVPGDLRHSTGLPKAIEHAVAYSIVAVVLTLAGRARWHILSIVVLSGALEFVQAWVPGRTTSPIDFLASSAGALLGFGLCSLVLATISRHSAWREIDRPAVCSRPFRYMSIAPTIAVGIVAVAVSMAAAHGAAGWLGAGLALVMLAIAVVDGRSFLIPDPLNFAGLALGIVNSAVLGRNDMGAALADAVLRAAVLALSFLALRLMYVRLRGRQGIGLGDVKLAAVAGAWLGWSVMPIAVEIAALSALAIYMLRRYALRRPLRPTSRLPFGLYFAPAIWIGWLLQTTVLQGR
jgi:leader peptidase (prepilin peptidase)/N-methyltransferase